MQVQIIDKDIYHVKGIYMNLTSTEQKFYSFLNAHDEISPGVSYECEFAGLIYDRNLTKIECIDINIKPPKAKTYSFRIRIDMTDISSGFVKFKEFYNLNCSELVVKIANLQKSHKEE